MAEFDIPEDGDDDWNDWMPEEQTALDFIKAQEAARRTGGADAGLGSNAEDEDSDDDWRPVAQEAAPQKQASVSSAPVASDSDDDWAPQIQGAADVEKSEKEALKALLAPPAPVQKPARYETQKEMDAAGKMLQELKRPPTIQEAKADIPRGPDVDPDAIPAPAYRSMTQDEALEFVMKGATLNCQGAHGRSPLHKAAEFAYPALVEAICDKGGDVDIRDNYGETPLLLLAQCGSWNDSPKSRRSETLQMLLACGADVHAVNPRGRTALHLACTENDHMFIETCIEGMADVNAQDLAGFTPLMWAAGRNGAETVKMLLDFEADMNVKAARGQTAMTFALTNDCTAIVDVLERHKMLLDAEEARQIKEKGESNVDELDYDAALQLPKPAWACKRPRPQEVRPYEGRRVYMHAKPDRHSNVYS